jgi:hypothetical protein
MSSDFDLRAFDDIHDPTAGVAPPPPLPPAKLPASPTRGELRVRRTFAAVFALGAAAAFALALGPRSDLREASHAGLVPTIIVVLLAALAGWFAALYRPSGGAPRWAPWLLAPFALFAVAGAMHTGSGVPASMPRATIACLLGSMAIAAIPLAALVYAYRHAFATSARKRSLALGVTAGAMAAAAMELHCSVDSAAHMIAGHGSALLLAGLLGLAATRLVRA